MTIATIIPIEQREPLFITGLASLVPQTITINIDEVFHIVNTIRDCCGCVTCEQEANSLLRRWEVARG